MDSSFRTQITNVEVIIYVETRPNHEGTCCCVDGIDTITPLFSKTWRKPLLYSSENQANTQLDIEKGFLGSCEGKASTAIGHASFFLFLFCFFVFWWGRKSHRLCLCAFWHFISFPLCSDGHELRFLPAVDRTAPSRHRRVPQASSLPLVCPCRRVLPGFFLFNQVSIKMRVLCSLFFFFSLPF